LQFDDVRAVVGASTRATHASPLRNQRPGTETSPPNLTAMTHGSPPRKSTAARACRGLVSVSVSPWCIPCAPALPVLFTGVSQPPRIGNETSPSSSSSISGAFFEYEDDVPIRAIAPPMDLFQQNLEHHNRLQMLMFH
jgi:hypothetical protein